MQSDSARLSVVMVAFAVVVFLASVASASLSQGEQPWLGPLSVVVLLPGTAALKAMLYVLDTGLPLMLWVFLVGVVSWAFWTVLGYGLVSAVFKSRQRTA